ncbi:MAG: RCC1 domain-containing protein, partial [Polyangiaceae bacterium]
PTDVQGVTNVTSLAAGCKHVCVSLDSGGVKCWGWDDQGQIGDGKNDNVNVAVDVATLPPGAEFVTAGFHSSCAAFPNGAECWGDDSMGELGDGAQASQNVPVEANQLTFGPIVMASGAYHVFAYAPGQGQTKLASWGENPFTGGLTGAIDNASAGDSYTCALQKGAALCWGQDNLGQLGRGSHGAPDQNAAQVQGLGSGVTAVAAGFDHACAFLDPLHIKCWGNNANGELGNDSTAEGDAPVDVKWP